jgi:hypothetical protein
LQVQPGPTQICQTAFDIAFARGLCQRPYCTFGHGPGFPKIPKPTSAKEELEKAVQLHDAVSLDRDAEESLVTIVEIFRNELVPRPSICDLGFETAPSMR